MTVNELIEKLVSLKEGGMGDYESDTYCPLCEEFHEIRNLKSFHTHKSVTIRGD